MFIGCSQKHIVGSVGSPTFYSLKERALRQKGEVTLVDGQKYAAERIRLRPDSTSWINPEKQGVFTVETAKIYNVKLVDRGKGALQGAGTGFLSGFMFGTVLGIAVGQPGIGAVVGLYFFGPLGSLVGVPIGAIAGSKDIFVMTTQAPVLVQQLPGSKLLPEELSYLTGNQIRVRVSEGIKYQGFLFKGSTWLEGSVAGVGPSEIVIRMEWRGGMVRIPFNLITELQMRKSSEQNWAAVEEFAWPVPEEGLEGDGLTISEPTISTVRPPGELLPRYGSQIRVRAFAGVKYYKKSEDQIGVVGNEGIKGNGFLINKGGNWLEGTAAYISSGAIAIKMEGEGGIVRIPFRFIYELQVRKSNGEAWSPIWADDELALSRELGVEK